MESEFFGTERISRILMRLAPPVMLAQLIQALYNIVDSFFVAQISENAMTALSWGGFQIRASRPCPLYIPSSF